MVLGTLGAFPPCLCCSAELRARAAEESPRDLENQVIRDVRLEPVQDPAVGRLLDGLFLTRPTEWDDPYRFFGW